MKTSESIKNISKALLEAQKQMGAAVKGSNNPYFKSKYADLGAVMEATKPALNGVGILVLQPPVNRDGKNFIETTLIHAESGEFMTSETEVVCAKVNDPQAFGAAQTYARRFGLQSMTFTPAEDDDGNKASGRETPAKQPVKATSVTPEKVQEIVQKAAEAQKEQPVIGATLTTVVAAETTAVQPLKSSKFTKASKKAVPVEVQQDNEGF
jgi:hypothetical protein